MMEHAAMIELMQQALDDGLDDAARARLAAHAAACTGCAQEWARLQALHRQLLAAPQQAAAAGFTARVLARIAAEQAAAPLPVSSALPARAMDRSWHSRMRPAPALLLLAAAGLLGLIALGLILAPLAGLANVDVWIGFFADSLGLLTAGIAWLSVLLTFIMVGVQTAGDGLLAAAVVFGMGMTFIWIRLVAGTDFVRRPTYSNGGV